MAPNSPEWQAHPSVAEAETSFQESLHQDPFEGAAVVAALAKIIKATDAMQRSSGGNITVRDSSSFVIEHIEAARETASNVPAPEYTQMFEAQAKGWKGAIRATRASRAKKPQVEPTPTAKKSMSSGKSGSNT